MKQESNPVLEKDSQGCLNASVRELCGCHKQAKSLDALMRRVREAIELCLKSGNPR
jgi:predicted RNase H-like HicB family nuclease